VKNIIIYSKHTPCLLLLLYNIIYEFVYILCSAECAGMYFEEQGAGFRCPQCSGPRRRYAKKVGDRVGTTLDGGDAPILIFSFGGLIATIAFGIWAVQNL
jgi:hypothetical protein